MPAHPPTFAAIADLTAPETLRDLLGSLDGSWQLRRVTFVTPTCGANTLRTKLSDTYNLYHLLRHLGIRSRNR